MINYELGPIRPPDEADSLLIRTTRGCPWNRCKFCTLFKGIKFSIRTVEEIKQDIAEAKKHYGDNTYDTCFLQDGDSFAMRTSDLIEVLQTLKQAFPSLKRISAYGRAQSMLRKTAKEMQEISEAGLNMLYCGVESGSDKVLETVGKGVTAAAIVQSSQRAKKAGMNVIAFVILGLGGKELSEQHITETAKVLNQINPDTIRLMSLGVKSDTDLMKLIKNGSFTMVSEAGMIAEQKLLLNKLEGVTSHYVNYHGVNLLREIDGTLPQDKDSLLKITEKYLSLSNSSRLNFTLGRRLGYYQRLSDLENTTTFNMIQGRVDEIRRDEIMRKDPEAFESIFHDLRNRII